MSNATRNTTVDRCTQLGIMAAPAIDVYPNCAVVAVPFDSARLSPLSDDGYSLCPSGRKHTLVIPHREA